MYVHAHIGVKVCVQCVQWLEPSHNLLLPPPPSTDHLQSKLVYFMMNIHTGPRTIYLTRVSGPGGHPGNMSVHLTTHIRT